MKRNALLNDKEGNLRYGNSKRPLAASVGSCYAITPELFIFYNVIKLLLREYEDNFQ